jgi:hypothetical protein
MCRPPEIVSTSSPFTGSDCSAHHVTPSMPSSGFTSRSTASTSEGPQTMANEHPGWSSHHCFTIAGSADTSSSLRHDDRWNLAFFRPSSPRVIVTGVKT